MTEQQDFVWRFRAMARVWLDANNRFLQLFDENRYRRHIEVTSEGALALSFADDDLTAMPGSGLQAEQIGRAWVALANALASVPDECISLLYAVRARGK
jgi:hypothetical protein